MKNTKGLFGITLLIAVLAMFIAPAQSQAGLAGIAQTLWSRTVNILHPADNANDVAIGGATSSAPFFYDTSAESLILDQGGTNGPVLNLTKPGTNTGTVLDINRTGPGAAGEAALDIAVSHASAVGPAIKISQNNGSDASFEVEGPSAGSSEAAIEITGNAGDGPDIESANWEVAKTGTATFVSIINGITGSATLGAGPSSPEGVTVTGCTTSAVAFCSSEDGACDVTSANPSTDAVSAEWSNCVETDVIRCTCLF